MFLKYDYVHRVGRTGRAGNKGTAYTFITPEEEEYSRDIYKALKTSGATIPEPLQKMFDDYEKRRTAGTAKKRKSGFGGQGYKFNADEQAEKERIKKLQRLAAGIEECEEDVDLVDDEEVDDDSKTVAYLGEDGVSEVTLGRGAKVLTQQQITELAAVRVRQLLDEMASQPGSIHSGMRFTDELEVNDYPQEARCKVLQKEALDTITELSGRSVLYFFVGHIHYPCRLWYHC